MTYITRKKLPYLFCALLTIISGSNIRGQQLARSNPPTNLEQKTRYAELIVLAEFLGTENRKRAEAPIKVLEVLKGSVNKETRIVTFFRSTALAVSPIKGSKWIFFLHQPFETKDGMEHRKILGKSDESNGFLPYDYEGILPATKENVQIVKRLVGNH